MSPLESVLLPIAEVLDLDGHRIAQGLIQGLTVAEILGIGPKSLEAIYGAAFVQLSAGRTDQAERLFEALTLLEPRARHYWLGLSICLKAAGDIDGSLTRLDAAEALSPDWAPIHFHRLETMISLGQWNLAKEALAKFEASPKHGISMFMIRQAMKFAHALSFKKG
jgi:predicted Zn-dependent protease